MSSVFAQASFEKGQLVTNTCTGQEGLIIGVWYNDCSGQYVYNVRVPGISGFVSWNELCTEVAATADALVEGDMVIAHDDNGDRHMGQVVGKTFGGELIARFAIGTHVVALARVWRCWPMSAMAQTMAVAS
jgi:hypothetical protein